MATLDRGRLGDGNHLAGPPAHQHLGPGSEAQGQGHRSTRLGVVISVAKLDIAVPEPDIAPAGSAFAADGGCGRGTTDRHHGRRQAYGGDVGMARAMTVVI